MSGDPTPEISEPSPEPSRRHGLLRRVVFGVTAGTFGVGLVFVIASIALAAIEGESAFEATSGDPLLALVLVALASWGVAVSFRSPPRPPRNGRVPTAAWWLLATLLLLIVLGWTASRFPKLGAVETVLLSCAALGVLLRQSDRLHFDDRVARAAAAFVLAGVFVAVLAGTGNGKRPPMTASSAGPEQLAAAAKSGETVRLRGRTTVPERPDFDGHSTPNIDSFSQVPIVEVRRSLLGFENERIEVNMKAMWDGDQIQALVVQQYTDTARGTARIEPVLLRSGSVFSADPLTGSVSEAPDAPQYRDVPVPRADVITEKLPWGVEATVMNSRGRANDDGNGANDTVLARVAPDRKSVDVVSAFAVSYPRLQSHDTVEDPLPDGIQGRPTPTQRWLDRYQPKGRELVVAIGHLSKDGGSARLVHFTADGPQPFAMTEVG